MSIQLKKMKDFNNPHKAVSTVKYVLWVKRKQNKNKRKFFKIKSKFQPQITQYNFCMSKWNINMCMSKSWLNCFPKYVLSDLVRSTSFSQQLTSHPWCSSLEISCYLLLCQHITKSFLRYIKFVSFFPSVYFQYLGSYHLLLRDLQSAMTNLLAFKLVPH